MKKKQGQDTLITQLRAIRQMAYNRGYMDGLKQAHKIWKDSMRRAGMRLS